MKLFSLPQNPPSSSIQNGDNPKIKQIPSQASPKIPKPSFLTHQFFHPLQERCLSFKVNGGDQSLYYLLSQNMQADNPLQTLPRRQYDQPMKFSGSQKKMVMTNFFQIKFSSKDSTIYQFAFDTTPEIPQDAKEILYELIRSIRKQLKDKIGFVTSSGLMIWGVKNLNIPLSIKASFMYKEKEHIYDVVIKPTKSLDVNGLLKTADGARMVFQIYNNKIKGVLRDKKMDEVNPGKYFDKKENRIDSIGLTILRGYKFTLCNLKGGMSLQIDVCSRVFRSANLLEEILKMPKDSVEALVGSTIITRYGKIRTYVIQKFDYSQSPASTFYHEKRAGKITYAQYYQESYGLKIKQMKQPLIEVVIRTEKKLNKEGVLEKIETRGFLIPEFVSLTGMSDEQRADWNTMKEIAPFTKLTPEERMTQTEKLINTLNGPEFQIRRAKGVTAYQLDDPSVKLASKNVYRAKDGTLNFKDNVKMPISFKDWVIVYSTGKYAENDDKQADNLSYLIKEASKAFGIEFSSPGFITCASNLNSWKQEIRKDVEKNGKPQIILLFFNNFEDKFYGELKRYITCELKLPSQGVKRKTVGNKAKSPMSAASKIIIQMNQKVGGITWEVNKNEYFDKRKSMYGAFSISKGKKGFTLAFVGTLNPENTRVFNFCKTGYRRKEDIPKADFDTIFLNWAKNYVTENKEGPSIIMIYREGLSIPQIQVQIKPEIDALRDVIKKIGEKTKKPNYNPELMYIIVNKKINTRIFDTNDKMGAQGKFPPKVFNPSSGTVVFDQISVDNLYDFHLTAQKVTQGTCTPTHYIVVRNESKIPQESLAQFTYEQCFNYYNWQGAVKVPACLQCADKLAKLVGQSIQASVTDGDVTKSFYFL